MWNYAGTIEGSWNKQMIGETSYREIIHGPWSDLWSVKPSMLCFQWLASSHLLDRDRNIQCISSIELYRCGFFLQSFSTQATTMGIFFSSGHYDIKPHTMYNSPTLKTQNNHAKRHQKNLSRRHQICRYFTAYQKLSS